MLGVLTYSLGVEDCGGERTACRKELWMMCCGGDIGGDVGVFIVLLGVFIGFCIYVMEGGMKSV